MNATQLKQALHAGRRVYGTLIASPSPRWPDAVARIGLDFVFIDTEHIALDRTQISWMCQVYRRSGLTPIVRIPSPDPFQACMALDGGAGGVVAPYIESIEQAQALRGAVKLRPIKGDRLAAALQRSGALEADLQAFADERNRDSLFILNIESTPAIDRLDQLLAVPGLDAILIGPHDLSCSLGIPERYDDPRFEAAVLRIIRAARAAGVGAGMHWSGATERFGPWMDAGLNLIICSADITAMQVKLGADIAMLRQRAGDAPATRGNTEAI
jgi:2-keto-3-deoxy-L-rhamnonate aldolase RhmA